MKPSPPARIPLARRARRLRQSGAALLFALLLISVMGLLTAGWIALVTARTEMVEEITAASRRRLALENSKALAQEFMLERVTGSLFANPIGTHAYAYDLADPAWGGIRVWAWYGAPLLSEDIAADTNTPAVNPFSPAAGAGFTLDVWFIVRDGEGNPSRDPVRRYRYRSGSPLLDGTLPALSNLPPPRQTNNPAIELLPVAVPLAFSLPGLNAIDNPHLAANSAARKATESVVARPATFVKGTVPSAQNGVVCDGAGNVTITLDTPTLGHVYIPGDIRSLTLLGQPTANNAGANALPATLVVVNQSALSLHDLATLTLSQNNNRRLVVAVKKATASPLALATGSGNANWRLLLELENTPLTVSGNATLRGGIRSDGATAGTGTLTFAAENAPAELTLLATRTAWVESTEPPP